MKLMTQYLLDTYSVNDLNQAFSNGYKAGLASDSKNVLDARNTLKSVRKAYGLSESVTDILTKPESNLKLAKADKPRYGLTLYHYVFKSRLNDKLILNLCPNAGDCTKVCVIENGHGSRPSTQLAWRWRSDLLAHHANDFMILLGWELARAIIKHGSILVRPNVNSDIQWEKIVPSMVDGSVTGDSITYYGYTKIPEYLNGDGDITSHYRVCYSYNENSPAWGGIYPFIKRGGSVAIVTNRKPKTDIKQWSHYKVIDVDLTDEWIFQKGVIGDMSAKGKAINLIGKSGFVTNAY